MRFNRTAVVGVLVASASVFGVFAAVGKDGSLPAPEIEYGASGCPSKPYEGVDVRGWPTTDRHARVFTRDLVREGADHAVLCRGFDAQQSSWQSVLRIDQRVAELEHAANTLTRTEPGGASTLVGYSATNLVLHHPDGRRTVLSFEFNRDEVSAHNAIRGEASHLISEFTRLWRAEHAAADPSKIEPADCPARMPDPRKEPISLPAAERVVRGVGRFGDSDDPRLPSPLAAARACRYTADERGRLTLRSQDITRTGLEPLRTAVNTAERPKKRLRCGEWWKTRLTALDTLHLADVTGRGELLYIARRPCEAYLIGGHPAGSVPPEAKALLSGLLD